MVHFTIELGVPLTAKPIQTGIRYLWLNIELPVGSPVRITVQAKSGNCDVTESVAYGKSERASGEESASPAPPPEKKPGF